MDANKRGCNGYAIWEYMTAVGVLALLVSVVLILTALGEAISDLASEQTTPERNPVESVIDVAATVASKFPIGSQWELALSGEPFDSVDMECAPEAGIVYYVQGFDLEDYLLLVSQQGQALVGSITSLVVGISSHNVPLVALVTRGDDGLIAERTELIGAPVLINARCGP